MILPEPVGYVELVDSPENRARAESLLSGEELERRETFRHDGRRRSFALGRLAARTLIGRRLDCPPTDVSLAVLDDGSIDVTRRPIQVSITHSGDFAAAAVSDGPVGVDLELVRSRSESLFRFVLHPDEFHLRDSVSLDQDHQLVLFWTLKEAVLKAQRTGLRQSPKSLRLEFAGDSAIIRGRGVWRASFDVHADRIVSVVWPHRSSGASEASVPETP